MRILTYNSPIGVLYIAIRDNVIIAISFSALDDIYLKKLMEYPVLKIKGVSSDELEKQLESYFSGRDPHFNLALELHGTAFQQKVWTACATIPYGETRSYANIAAMIGNPKAVRAVGTALGANPIPIVIPCHRVIGSNGALTGFAGGLDVKQSLLDMEKM